LNGLPAAAIGKTTWLDRAAIAVAVLVLLPVLSLGVTALAGRGAPIALASAAGAALRETGILLLGVAVLTTVLGVGAAWLVSAFQFPGRKILAFALVLPFAVPTYIAAYSYVEMFDYFGPAQTALRALAGWRSRSEYWFPELRSMGGAILVTSLVLYPYVYVACRAAFALQGAELNDAARMLGASRAEALRRVVLPVVWPALAAGLTLVVFETLNDIGASQHLGVQTLTVAIYSAWLNRNSLIGAAQLALLALLVVMLVVFLERALRNNRRFAANVRPRRPSAPLVLAGWRGAAAMAACALPVAAGFGVPAYILGRAAWRDAAQGGVSAELWTALGWSVFLSAVATAVVLAASVLMSVASRLTRRKVTEGAAGVAGLGYALPGTVLVIGLLPLLGGIDGWLNDAWRALGGGRLGLVLSGSIAAIVIAYAIRFLVIGLDQGRAGLNMLSRNADSAAEALGCAQPRLIARILAPAMATPLAGAGVLVFVDCMKELPATLILRPLNVETLATLLYGHAVRGSFEDGAAAALLIVLVGLIPLVLMSRLIDNHMPITRD
jgi:iron(III) transport system permease protein